MSSEEEDQKLDPKLEKRLAFTILSLFSFLFIFCMVDLQSNLGIGHALIGLTFGERILQSTAKIVKFEALPSRPSQNDKFEDLQSIFDESIKEKPYKNYEKVIFKDPKRVEKPETMGDLLGFPDGWKKMTSLDRFQMAINKYEMYSEDSVEVAETLENLVTSPISYVYEKNGGTQFKMIISFQNKEKAHCKPWRMPRDQEANPNHFYFNDFERHNAEIAAYHVDKALGFRRSIPHIGRIVNMTSEIFPNADGALYDTFYISPDNNVCMYGECEYYCSSSHPICGNPDMLEISIGAHLPRHKKTERKVWRNPWRRSYSKRRKVPYHVNENYCEIIKTIPPYNGTRLLDLIDLHIFDFFIGNQDRHHYETFKIFGNDTFIIALDHGRTFGFPNFDDLEILTPISTCCMIHESTLKMLLRYHNGEKKLSDAVRESMIKDPIAPILWEPHLIALDRRLAIVLQAFRNCLRKKDFEARNEV